MIATLLLLALFQFSSGVNLVEVYATVTDRKGEPVLSLTRNEFQVFEDGRPQRIDTFAAGEFPLTVALAIDRSFSMAGERLALARSAARAFLGELRPTDRSMLIGIGSEVDAIAPLSVDRSAQLDALARVDAWGTTVLYDAIARGMALVQGERGRRALIVLSDGDDRSSHMQPAELLDVARRHDVMVYPVAFGRQRPALFAELAVVTGGRSIHVKDPRQMAEALRGIARELRHQYLLGYVPDRPLSGGPAWRSILVRVDRPGARVRARDGYALR